MRKLIYFPIETVKSRYTEQLCRYWMPDAFESVIGGLGLDFDVLRIEGEGSPDQIRCGSVLDATGRGHYSMKQASIFLKGLESKEIKPFDVIYLQDFWTPGIEAMMYAMEQYEACLPIYAMCHAQSVDPHDFTARMLPWIRHYEKGLDAWMVKHGGAIFVASTIHKKQLRKAGFNAPIHVVGLPIDPAEVSQRMGPPALRRGNTVIFTSRTDPEKNPSFMLEVAKEFLTKHPGWTWEVTTSAESFSEGFKTDVLSTFLTASAEVAGRFSLLPGLTKEDYYHSLSRARIQFNCSSQDYVSWTLLEAVIAGCDIAYPRYCSFPEIIPPSRMYRHLDKESALRLLHKLTEERAGVYHWYSIASRCNSGRLRAAHIALTGADREHNIWLDKEPSHG